MPARPTNTSTEQHCTDCNVLLIAEGDDLNRYLDTERCIECALRFRYCPNCGEFLLRNTMRNDQCRPCFKLDPRLAEYHTKLDPTIKLGEGSRYFGVELECEAKDQTAASVKKYLIEIDDILGDAVTVKKDASLANRGEAGLEIVTRPATLQHQYLLWDKFLRRKPRGLISWDSERCGMHVHVSRDGLTEQTIARAVCFVNAAANKKFMFVVAGRKDNTYTVFKQKSIDSAAKFSGERHEAVNLSNEQTIEFRLFKGTLKRESVFKNIEFCDAVLDFVSQEDMTLAQSISRAAFVRFIRQSGKWPHLLGFIMARWFGKQNDLAKDAGWNVRKNCASKDEYSLMYNDDDHTVSHAPPITEGPEQAEAKS